MRLIELFDMTEPDLLLEAAKDRYMQIFPEEAMRKLYPLADMIDQQETFVTTRGMQPHGFTLEDIKLIWEREVDWAVNTLQRADRITWHLRFYKIGLMREMTRNAQRHLEEVTRYNLIPRHQTGELKGAAMGEYLANLKDQMTPVLENNIKRVMQEMQKLGFKVKQDTETHFDKLVEKNRALFKKLTQASEALRGDPRNNNLRSRKTNAERAYRAHNNMVMALEAANRQTEDFGDLRRYTMISSLNPVAISHEYMEHFFSMPIPGIQNQQFGMLHPGYLKALFQHFEVRWSDAQQRNIPEDDPSMEHAERIIEFPDGKVWWNLHKSYCDREGKAMGHCGNSYRKERPVDVLTLREPVKVEGQSTWQVDLTFVWNNKTGMIEESKGFKNQKPDPKYHPYIVELLKQPWVRGLDQSRSHEPGQNFSMDDLDEESREELFMHNPGLGGAIADEDLEMDRSLFKDYGDYAWLTEDEQQQIHGVGYAEMHNLYEQIITPREDIWWKVILSVAVLDDEEKLVYIGVPLTEEKMSNRESIELAKSHWPKIAELLLTHHRIRTIDDVGMEGFEASLNPNDFPEGFMEQLIKTKPTMGGAIEDDVLNNEYDFAGVMYEDESGWFINYQRKWILFQPFDGSDGEVFWQPQGYIYSISGMTPEAGYAVNVYSEDETNFGIPIEEEMHKYMEALIKMKGALAISRRSPMQFKDFPKDMQAKIKEAKPDFVEVV